MATKRLPPGYSGTTARASASHCFAGCSRAVTSKERVVVAIEIWWCVSSRNVYITCALCSPSPSGRGVGVRVRSVRDNRILHKNLSSRLARTLTRRERDSLRRFISCLSIAMLKKDKHKKKPQELPPGAFAYRRRTSIHQCPPAEVFASALALTPASAPAALPFAEAPVCTLVLAALVASLAVLCAACLALWPACSMVWPAMEVVPATVRDAPCTTGPGFTLAPAPTPPAT
jgi:hypothetical protein